MITKARIYTAQEHIISNDDIDPDVLNIISRLRAAGYEAYIVGGAVRDLLLQKVPKDFDVATDATPNRIRRIFRNSRIIGRRFRLVHVFFRDNKIIELATFRSDSADNFVNQYGTIEQDVKRRDFTVNALMYDPDEEAIIDYVDGVVDIKKRRLQPIIPLDRIFLEDPVRILRAIKYSIIGNLNPGKILWKHIKRSANLLAKCSRSRITEEFFKILLSGHMAAIFDVFMRFDILQFIQPNVDARVKKGGKKMGEAFMRAIRELDEDLRKDGSIHRYEALSYYIRTFVDEHNESFDHAFDAVKFLIQPITPPNVEVELAIRIILYGKDSVQSEFHTMRSVPNRQRARRRRRRSSAKTS